MGNYHDPVRQLKYLRQTLSQNKKPLGFFMSAGCPLAVKMENDKWPLIPDIAGLTKYVTEQLCSKDQKKKTNYDLLLSELGKTKIINPNIEDILSFVRSLKQVSKGAKDVRGFIEKDLDDLEKNICNKIVEKVNVPLPNDNTPYHQFAKWIHNIERDIPIEVFTTNYDLLVEQAFEDIKVPYFDGFVGSRQPFFDLKAVEDGLIPKHWTRLWKIHGSINWFQKQNNEVYRSTEIKSDSYVIHPSHLKYDQSRKMPYLALIDRLNSFLRQNSCVLITLGYSFNDEHLNDTIINALRANQNSMVIGLLYNSLTYTDKDGNKYERYKNAVELAEKRSNLSLWSFDEAIIGGVRGYWQIINLEPQDNIANVIESNTPSSSAEKNSEKTIYNFKLSDFSIFGNFIQELIGEEQFKVDINE